jgi:hypothetical protein
MTTGWTIYVRDQNYRRQGQIDDYREATLTPVYNDVGTWSITLDRRAAQAAKLTTPGWGITVMRRDASAPVFAGPAAYSKSTVTEDEETLQVTGFTDDVWLRRRLVSPSPSESAPPYSNASDDQTGTVSTVLRHYVDVNLGPNAIAPRRLNGLVIAADPLLGSSVSASGRWDGLLEFMQNLAVTGDVGFRIVQSGFALLFQIYRGTDRSGTVKFSRPLETLTGHEYEITAPTNNHAFIGGTGDGVTRVMQQLSDSDSIADWGRIEGPLTNSSDTANVTQMTQDGNDALAQGATQTTLSITPLEKAGVRYGIDYQLGDTVAVQIEDGPGGVINDKLRSVEIHLVKDGPQTVKPAIGTPRAADVLRMSNTYRFLANLAKRMTTMEKH